MTERLPVRAALLLVCALLLSACGDGTGAPTAFPRISTSPPTPTSAAQAPTVVAPSPRPKQSQTPRRAYESFDGAAQRRAEALVGQWWNVVNSSIAGQGSIERLTPLFSRRCADCKTMYDEVAAATKNGRHAQGANLEVVSTSYSDSTGDSAVVLSTVRPRPGVVYDKTGAVVERYDGGKPADFIFRIARARDTLYVDELVPLGPRK